MDRQNRDMGRETQHDGSGEGVAGGGCEPKKAQAGGGQVSGLSDPPGVPCSSPAEPPSGGFKRGGRGKGRGLKKSPSQVRVSRLPQRAALVVALATGVFVFAVVAWGVNYVVTYPDRPVGESKKSQEVIIPQGASLSDVVRELKEKKILTHPSFFRLYVNQKGLAHRIRQGKYENLSGAMTPKELLSALITGPKVELKSVTIPEGKHMLEVADILAEAGFGERSELERLMRDTGFVKELGISGRTLEGYLFPDTYKFRVGASPRNVLKHMVKRHFKVTDDLKAKYPNGMVRLKHTFRFGHHEMVIMASIVEKETGVARERPIIASVYLNRLRFPWFKPKRLEADPTIIYGCFVPEKKSSACLKFKDRIRTAQLRDPDNPYNTYVHKGLPPGPIANPGRDAMKAVMRPADTKYVFFVSKNDGSHKFSETRAEHERAVYTYQVKGQRP